MNSEKSINLFEIEKGYATLLFMGQLFFLQFLNNFPALLSCKICVFDMLNIVDFFLIFSDFVI